MYIAAGIGNTGNLSVCASTTVVCVSPIKVAVEVTLTKLSGPDIVRS